MRDYDPADDRCGSFTTDAVEATRACLSAFARKRTNGPTVLGRPLCAIRVTNAVQQICTGLRSYLGLWSVRWHPRASAP
jgi:hypothetical protein